MKFAENVNYSNIVMFQSHRARLVFAAPIELMLKAYK